MNEQKGKAGDGRKHLKSLYRPLRDVSFLNPYNFVPVTMPNQLVDAEKGTGTTHTGYLSCRLIARTPLVIPDIEKKMSTYPFMSIDGKKVIPGSSIRGVIRNIYETVTDSCMVTVTGDDVITARTEATSAFLPGILKRESSGWKLYEADRVALVIHDGAHKEFNKQPDIKVHYNQSKRDNVLKIDGTEYVWGQRVWISMGEAYKKNGRPIWKATVQTICDKAQKNYVMGYLYVGERFTARKHAESVFVQKVKNGRSWEIDNEHLKKLEKTWEVYNDPAVNRNAKENGWYKGYERAKKGGVIPLWYREEKGKLYLSLASIGRKTYGNSLSDIRNVGKSCTNRNHVCKACALFGMVGDKSLGSRVRFTDAVCVGRPEMKGPVLLKELGSPKPSYLPFYTKGGKDYDDAEIEIRGRKFYWHNPAAALDPGIYMGKDASRSAEVEMAAPGTQFEFRVYYDEVTDEQLAELMWALTLGENDERSEHSHCIKIGHGKPLGLGSAKVLITGGVERCVDVIEGVYYVSSIDATMVGKYINNGAQSVKFSKGYEELMKITDFDAAKECTVCYPYIHVNDKRGVKKPNDAASHQWFKENRGTTQNATPGLLPNIKKAVENPLHPYELRYTESGGHSYNGNYRFSAKNSSNDNKYRKF